MVLKVYNLPILVLLLLVSCSKESIYQDDHFFIENSGAIMPVIVKGDLTSDVFVIFLHGGPGGNSTQATFLPVFQELEEDYTIAYWDQRASGLSQGNPNENTFTVEQFVQDLDLVVEAINSRYNSPQIFLFGHSWGGALGCAYLSTGNFQSKIAGFINMDSGHNLEVGLPASVVWVRNYAQDEIDHSRRVDYWTEVRDWCSTVPDMTIPDNYFKYAGYLKETNAYRKNPEEAEQAAISAGDIMNSYMSFAVFFNGAFLSRKFNILELNLSSQMSTINIPTLVLWGRHDGVNTIEMGNDAFNSIGNPDFMNKEFVILENSAHEGFVEEREQFQAEFRRFIDANK